MEVTPEQFRKEYTFLAPTDYLENFAEVILPSGAEVTLDGTPIAVAPEPIGASEWSFARVPLGSGNGWRAPDRDHGRGAAWVSRWQASATRPPTITPADST